MSSPLDAVLSRALAIRLNLQISLSSLPIVEEWMDVHLNRWLESVPLPPEMPMGYTANFGVVLACDLARMGWQAHGDPSGFVPKLSKYLDACRATQTDMLILDRLGQELEPKLVGSWVRVADEQLQTGWYFADAHPFAAIEPLFADHEAKRKLLGWLEESGVETVRRFVQGVGEEVFTELEFPAPGVSMDDQLMHLDQAFVGLVGQALPAGVKENLAEALSPEFALAVRIRDGHIVKLAALSPGLGNDVVAELCGAVGVTYDSKLPKLQNALGASGPDRVEYARILEPGTEPRTRVNVHLIPTDAAGLPIKLN